MGALRGKIFNLVATSKTAGFPVVVIIWLLVVVSRPDMVCKLEWCIRCCGCDFDNSDFDMCDKNDVDDTFSPLFVLPVELLRIK